MYVLIIVYLRKNLHKAVSGQIMLFLWRRISICLVSIVSDIRATYFKVNSICKYLEGRRQNDTSDLSWKYNDIPFNARKCKWQTNVVLTKNFTICYFIQHVELEKWTNLSFLKHYFSFWGPLNRDCTFGLSLPTVYDKALAIAIRTIAVAIAIAAKKAIEYCNMQ